MEARLNYFSNGIAGKFAKYINSAGAVVTESTLPAATQELQAWPVGVTGGPA